MKKILLVFIFAYASYRLFDMENILNFITIECFAIYGILIHLFGGKVPVKKEIIQFKANTKTFSDN